MVLLRSEFVVGEKNSNTTKEEKLEQGLKLGSQIGVEIKMSKKSIFVGSDLKSRMYCRTSSVHFDRWRDFPPIRLFV